MSIIVSADSHFNEPIDFYAPAHRRFGDVVPHVEFGDSGDFWASEALSGLWRYEPARAAWPWKYGKP